MTAESLPPSRDPREQECVCRDCGEGLYFVEGVVGKARWRHVRTGSPICLPRCRECDQPASKRIGVDRMGGDGFLQFVTKFWLCETCARGRLFIERT